MQEINRLENFPISFFATVMGLAGLTIAGEKIQHVLHVVLTLLYTAKLVRHRGEVIKELRNPIKLNFFPAISISLLLLSIATLLMYEQTATGAYLYLGGGLLLALTAVVALLLVKTAGAVRKRGVCVPEH